ncbi:MAG TPA: hypothetical protein VF188_08130 [Longimicrobiales bacterium]
MSESLAGKVPVTFRLFLAAAWLALAGMAAALVGSWVDVFAVRIVLIVMAVIAIVAAGACFGAAQKALRGGGAEQA